MLGTSASMITLSAVVHMVEVRGARKYHLGETECCSVTLRGTVRLLCQAISLRMTPWQSAICPPPASQNAAVETMPPLCRIFK